MPVLERGDQGQPDYGLTYYFLLFDCVEVTGFIAGLDIKQTIVFDF